MDYYIIAPMPLIILNLELNRRYGAARRESFVYLRDQVAAKVEGVPSTFLSPEAAQPIVDRLNAVATFPEYGVFKVYPGHECRECGRLEIADTYVYIRQDLIAERLCLDCYRAKEDKYAE